MRLTWVYEKEEVLLLFLPVTFERSLLRVIHYVNVELLPVLGGVPARFAGHVIKLLLKLYLKNIHLVLSTFI